MEESEYIEDNGEKYILNEITRGTFKNSMIKSKVYCYRNYIIEKTYFNDGNIKIKASYINDLLHSFDDKPALIKYLPNGKKDLEEFYHLGNLHRDSGPAQIVYTSSGDEKAYEIWYHMNTKIKKPTYFLTV